MLSFTISPEVTLAKRVGKGEARVPLHRIVPGDVVKGETRTNRVESIKFLRYVGPMYMLNGGELPSISDQQAVKTWTGWKSISGDGDGAEGQLAVGDKVYTESGNLVELKSIVPGGSGDWTIGIEIELDGDHTFYADGLLVHNKGGGGSSGGTTIQKTEPPAYLEPYLKDIASKAQGAYNQVPQGGFNGELLAPVNSNQTQAINQQVNLAQGMQNPGQATRTASQQLAGTDWMAPAQANYNPQSTDLNALINSSIEPVKRQLTEQILPQVQSKAVQQGAFGGSRQAVTEQGALRDFSNEASNIATQIGYSDFLRQDTQRFDDYMKSKELGVDAQKNMIAGATMIPTLDQAAIGLDLMPSQILQQAGNTQQLNAQDQLDAIYQKYLLSTQSPFAGLDQYASIVAGIPAGQTATLTGPRAASSGGGSWIGNAIGGGLSGYSLGASLGAGLGPVGAIGGALLGGLFG